MDCNQAPHNKLLIFLKKKKKDERGGEVGVSPDEVRKINDLKIRS
jgi:hypothetical protein